MSTPFTEAIAASIASLNTDGLTHDQWADASYYCARSFSVFGIDDAVVRSAAVLGGLIRSHPVSAPKPGPVVRAFIGTGTATVVPGERDAVRVEGRTALRFATHSANLNSQGLPLILLSAMERDLAAPAPHLAAASLSAALENWRNATAAVGRSSPDVSAHVAVAIAVIQRALLRRGRELLSGVEVNPVGPGSVDRLSEGIEASLQAWSSSAERWYDASVDTVPHDAADSPIRLLSLAATDLAATLARHSSPSLQLETLIRSGFGGNLIAGVVAAGASRIGNPSVVRAAARLELVADHFTDQRFAPPFRDRTPPLPTATASTPPPSTDAAMAPQDIVSPSGGVPEGVAWVSSRSAPDVPVQWLSREAEVDLALRRDAGTIAQAALDGDPTARSMTTTANQSELHHLAADGRIAVAQLIASMIPAMQSTNRWIPRQERADALQNAAVDVASAAARWDPRKGARWLTFAWNSSWWASTDSRKELDIRPIPVQFTSETLGRPLREAAPGPEETLLRNLEQSEQRHLLHQIRILNNDEIRPELLAVVLKYHGLGSEPPKNFTQIAQDHDSSPSTVARRYREAIEALRATLPTPPSVAEHKPWRRREHAPARPNTSLGR